MAVNKPLKVIFYTHDSYNLAPARIRCYNFSNILKRRGINSQVLSLVDHFGAKFDGSSRYRISDTRRIWLNIKAFIKLWKEKEAIIYIQKIDYHFLAPLLLHFIKGAKIIVDYDDYDMHVHPFKGLNTFPLFRAKPITRLLVKNSSAVITSSRYLERLLSTQTNNGNTPINYIPTGVDTEKFNLKAQKNGNKVIFSWIGILWGGPIYDNIISIIKAFSKIKNKSKARLEICGRGIFMKNLNDYIADHKISGVELKDWILPENIPEYLSGIDVGLAVFTGKTKFNMAKSPTKLFEYMAMQKPAITSSIGEARSIINNGVNGFLISSEHELTNSMDTLIENPALRQEIGINARKTIEKHYSLSKIGERLEQILRTL